MEAVPPEAVCPVMQPYAVFERRVRIVVHRMMILHPWVTREEAMLRARRIPPAQLPAAIRRLRGRMTLMVIARREAV